MRDIKSSRFFRRAAVAFVVAAAELLATLLAPRGAAATQWSPPGILHGSMTDTAPAAVTYGGTLFLFAKGTDGVVRYRMKGTTWGTSWTPLDGRTNTAPAATVFAGRLYLFVKGGVDGVIYYRSFNGSSWSGWSPIDSGTTNAAPAVAVYGGRLYVFVKGGIDGALYYRSTANGSSWSPTGYWPGVGTGTTNAAPAVVAHAGRLYLFVKGGVDGAIYYKSFNGSSWSGWSTVGVGTTNASPTVVSYGGRLFVFVKGGGDGQIYYRVLDQTLGWDAWLPHNEWRTWRSRAVATAPAVAVQGQTVNVFGASYPYLFVETVRWTTLKLKPVAVYDDGCVNGTSISGFDRWARYAGMVFAPGFIRFTVSDGVDACDTDLNQYTLDHAAATTFAKKYPGEIVVYLHQRSRGRGYSSIWNNYVALPPYYETNVCGELPSGGHENYFQLAHDIGHYFGLNHTFDVLYASRWDAEVALGKAGGNPAIFDGDDTGEVPVFDTPPDPGANIFGGCSTPAAYDLFGSTSFVRITPPLSNVMSYYNDDAGLIIQGLSRQQMNGVYANLGRKGLVP